MHYCVIGAGYVGMALADALYKESSDRITIIDNDIEKVKAINKRYEGTNTVAVTTIPKFKYDMFFIALPTDYNRELGKFNDMALMTYILRILETFPDTDIVIKSTVDVTFFEHKLVIDNISRIHYVPEFLRENSAITDFLLPDRIVIGTVSNEFADKYIQIMNKSLPVSLCSVKNFIVSHKEACFIKLASNAYLAMRVAFFNEISSMTHGLNTKAIIEGICADRRIGNVYNNPSFGFGGYCLPKDTECLANMNNYCSDLLGAVLKSNEDRADYTANSILGMTNCNDVIGIYRLQFKEDASNIRRSPVIGIVQKLCIAKRKVYVYEPLLDHNNIHSNLKLANSLDELLKISTIIVANRYSSELSSVKDKVFTYDLFSKDLQCE